MQGRQGQDKEPWDRSPRQHLAATNGNASKKQRGIPKRPPNMARIEQPPPTPRVARPQREAPRPANCRRRLLIWGVIAVVCCVLAFVIGYAVVNFFAATNATSGAATTATDFLSSLSSGNYDQAYNDLDATITVTTTPDEFKEQAQNDDHCYGNVTDYSEVADSATIQGNTQSYSFTITRSKLAHPYTLRLTLQQDSYGNWKISSYGNNNDLGPGQPTCG